MQASHDCSAGTQREFFREGVTQQINNTQTTQPCHVRPSELLSTCSHITPTHSSHNRNTLPQQPHTWSQAHTGASEAGTRKEPGACSPLLAVSWQQAAAQRCSRCHAASCSRRVLLWSPNRQRSWTAAPRGTAASAAVPVWHHAPCCHRPQAKRAAALRLCNPAFDQVRIKQNLLRTACMSPRPAAASDQTRLPLCHMQRHCSPNACKKCVMHSPQNAPHHHHATQTACINERRGRTSAVWGSARRRRIADRRGRALIV
jgi:hypothetical protein